VLILALETSCDETAAAIVDHQRRVLANTIASQHDLHAEYKGVVPEIASRAHAERIYPVVTKAIAEAGVTLKDINAIAVGNRPGLIGSLLVGVSAAKALAWSLGKPLIGVDHIHAHLYAGLLETDDDLDAVYPALGFVVSGGHTAIYRCDSPVDVARLGATIDDAMGEAFDKVATILGLPYPGGPNLDKLAAESGANDRAHDFPISRLARDSLDFSFSGLKTAVLYAVRGVPDRQGAFERTLDDLTPDERRDIAASFQRACVKAAVVKLKRALDRAQEDGLSYKTLLVGGGVSANSALRRELARLARSRNIALRLPAMEYCLDNAAMIGGLAHERLARNMIDDLSLRASPRGVDTDPRPSRPNPGPTAA
jgi:N6-L-threonylcarbamoyladenine synthase